MVVPCLASFSGIAHAGKYDLDLTSLGRTTGGTFQQNDAAFRSLASELGQLVHPSPMDPADSLGLSGFAVSTDISINTISSGASYWQETASSAPNGAVPTVQIVGRKGLWPGLEVGGGARHVFDSSMWSMMGYGKFALHEGFHHLPIPDISVRGGFARLLGAKDFDMSTASVAVTISHVFGLGKTFSLTPYAGYESLFIVARSTVLDATPNCDEFPDDYNRACPGVDPATPPEFAFRNAGVIVRHRPHLGLRLIFSVIRVGFEAMLVPGGRRTGTLSGVTVADGSGLQQQYTFSLGLDF